MLPKIKHGANNEKICKTFGGFPNIELDYKKISWKNVLFMHILGQIRLSNGQMSHAGKVPNTGYMTPPGTGKYF